MTERPSTRTRVMLNLSVPELAPRYAGLQCDGVGLMRAVFLAMSIGVPLGAVVAVLIAYLFMLREWEYVADRAAVVRAGSDKVLAAFAQYQAASGEKNASALSELFSGHPSIHRRVAAIQRQLEVPQ